MRVREIVRGKERVKRDSYVIYIESEGGGKRYVWKRETEIET